MGNMNTAKSRAQRTKAKEAPLSEESIKNSVLTARKTKGLTQAELAKHVGLTRQAMHAIEHNQYLPNTSLALRLARALGCTVEELFSLPTEGKAIEAELLGTAPFDGSPLRVKVSQVGNRMIARPLSQLGDMLNFVLPADGIVTGTVQHKQARKSPRVHVNLLHNLEQIEQQIVIAGCDPSLFLAGEHVRSHHALAGVTNWTMGSTSALQALLQGEVHMAGVHLVDSKSGESNIPYLKRHLHGEEFLGVRFASWIQGLLIKPGNPKHIRTVDDIGKRGIQVINREAGSGARLFLDSLLKTSGIDEKKVKGYDLEVGSHLEVARLIRDGMGDVGIGVEAAARQYGLEFIPLREEHYDLILRQDVLASHPMIHQLFDTIVSRPFRQELHALGGYDLAEIGKSLHW